MPISKSSSNLILILATLAAMQMWVPAGLGADPTATTAASADDLNAVLKHRIIEADLPLREVQAFTESRIARMPAVTTAQSWAAYSDKLRQDVLEKVVFRGQAAQWRKAPAGVERIEPAIECDGYRVRKLRYEAVPGLWIPALLYEPAKLTGKVPVVFCPNGHDPKGKIVAYKQIRCINLAKRGMIVLNTEYPGMGQLQGADFSHYRSNQLDLCGTSGVAVFYLAMERALDLLLAHEHADGDRLAVAGLSGGGWQTIFIGALDRRVALANPVAGYESFRTRVVSLTGLGDSEQTPVDLACLADYTHLTAMRGPRPTLLTYNTKDGIFFPDKSLPLLLEAAEPIFKMYGKKDNLRPHINEVPGDHNFEQDNREAFYKFVGEHFFAGQKFDAKETPCQKELLTADQACVPLPENNMDFHKLAVALAKDLPRNAEPPKDPAAMAQWQKQRRQVLGQVVHLRSYTAKASPAGEKSVGDVAVKYWRVAMDKDWTLPVIELTPPEWESSVIVLADGGMAAAGAKIASLLKAHRRVIAVDLFYFGQSAISQRDFLFALLVSSVGERPLGVQAGQLAAIARWASRDGEHVTVKAIGPRTSLIALTTAALDESVAGVDLAGGYGSLKEILDADLGADKTPELFCFGLLDQFDICTLKAMVAPRTVLRTELPTGRD